MSSQPKEYLVFVGARIDTEDFVRMKKCIRGTDETIADCIRACIHNSMAGIDLDETDNEELDYMRCQIHEARKRYSKKQNGRT